jgi:hypothetical protein
MEDDLDVGRDADGREPPLRRVARLVSGGQSGVDRAALDAALAAGLPHGGWCPAGGWVEDLPTPPGPRASEQPAGTAAPSPCSRRS